VVRLLAQLPAQLLVQLLVLPRVLVLLLWLAQPPLHQEQ
jgi:hypothetical protein